MEDNLLNQKLAIAVLNEVGIDVEIAENGQIAVERLKEKPFDFVLMDIQMPVMDGYQATREIRHGLNLTVPIIAMTANAMAGEREKCINSGMDEYITKPFNPDVLFNMLKKFMKEDVLPQTSVLEGKERLTDLTYLREFSGGKDSFVKDIIMVFLEQNPIDIKTIETVIAANDIEGIKAIAHSLQTSLSFVGFKKELIKILKDAEENMTDAKGIEQTKTSMKTIIDCCKLAQEELKEEFSKM